MAAVSSRPSFVRNSARIRSSDAHRILVEAGGIASASHIADRLTRETGSPTTVRQVRDGFKNYANAVRKLGAGYYGTASCDVPDVREWVDEFLHESGAASVDEVVFEVLESYPNGNERAVRCWVHQVYGRDTIRPGS